MDSNWIQLGKQALWELVGAKNQGSTSEWILLLLAVIALVLVFSRVSQMSNVGVSSPGVSLAAFSVGVIALAGSWMLLDDWVIPALDVRIAPAITRGLAVALSLVVTVPAMCLILRAHAQSVLMAWGGGLLVAILLLWLGNLGLEALFAGSEGAQRTKARSEEMQDFLNEH